MRLLAYGDGPFGSLEGGVAEVGEGGFKVLLKRFKNFFKKRLTLPGAAL